MRILLLSQYYYPEPNFKANILGESLKRKGHNVKVLTGFPNYPNGQIYPGYSLKWHQVDYYNEIPVHRVPLFPDRSDSAVARSLNYISFALAASVLGYRSSQQIDLIWAYHPPVTVGIPAWWLSLLRRVPFVLEIQDLWPDAVLHSGMVRNSIALNTLRHFTQSVYCRANAIIVISPGFKKTLVERGIAEEKVHVISNWADDTVHFPVPRQAEIGEGYNLVGHFNIMFSGNMGNGQALEHILEAAKLLHNTPIQFVLIGDGLKKSVLENYARQLNLKNVIFVPRVPVEKVRYFHAWADALIVQLRDLPHFHYTIPSKTLSYLAYARPILCGVPGDAAALIREIDAGLIYSPENPEVLAQTIWNLYLMPASARKAMGQAARHAFLSRFTPRAIIPQYEQLFTKLVFNQ